VARTLSKLLTTRRPKLISGPEVFNNLLGSSEQKVRELFKPAEEEWKRKKEGALLHVIIIDEIDALARSRGGAGGASSGDSGSSSGAHRDSVVNQLLAKIDGLEQQNNVLVIGTTNRLDMIDPAVKNVKIRHAIKRKAVECIVSYDDPWCLRLPNHYSCSCCARGV